VGLRVVPGPFVTGLLSGGFDVFSNDEDDFVVLSDATRSGVSPEVNGVEPGTGFVHDLNVSALAGTGPFAACSLNLTVCQIWQARCQPRRDKGPMDFNYSPEQVTFADEVEKFLDEHEDPEVFDLTRENMAQIVDTPRRREFMAELGNQGWLGITWPEEYGGKASDGFYEYLLNEALARRGGPQIGKGVGIIGKTLILHGSEKLKQEFLPKILRNEVEFAVGYS